MPDRNVYKRHFGMKNLENVIIVVEIKDVENT